MFNPIQIKYEYSGVDVNQSSTSDNSKCSNFTNQSVEYKYRQFPQFWDHSQIPNDVSLKNEMHLHSSMLQMEGTGSLTYVKDYLQHGVLFQFNQHQEQNINQMQLSNGCQQILIQDNQHLQNMQNVQHSKGINETLTVIQSGASSKQNRSGRPLKDSCEPSITKKLKCQCEICFKEFGHKSNLFIHMRTHNGERPYKCNQCEKCFTHSGNLAIHMRTHSGERPYGCQVCGKMFSHSGNLSTHLRTHSGVKPYKCSICAKEFRHSGNLSIHERIHSGIKPFQCKVCGKDFYHSGNLSTHMKKHSVNMNSNVNQCTINRRQITDASGDLNDSTSPNGLNKTPLVPMINDVKSMHSVNNLVHVKNESVDDSIPANLPILSPSNS